MATLTQPQTELLVWIVEQASGAILYTPTLGEGDSIMPARPGPDSPGGDYPMNATDLRELEAQGLLRRGPGSSWEVTNEGRIVYDELRNPPPERPPVGFAPNQ
jgi:hypothetical protein